MKMQIIRDMLHTLSIYITIWLSLPASRARLKIVNNYERSANHTKPNSYTQF